VPISCHLPTDAFDLVTRRHRRFPIRRQPPLIIADAAFPNRSTPFEDGEQIEVIGREVGLVNASQPSCVHRHFGPDRKYQTRKIRLLAAETTKVDRTTKLKLARAS
jgi:hypothetical protein